MSKQKKSNSKTHPSAHKEAPDPASDDAAEQLVDVPEAEPVQAAEQPEASGEEVWKDRFLRLQADFDNYRKRADREKKEWVAYASEKLAADILPAMDNFELGLKDGQTNGTPPALLEGFVLIYNQLQAALAKAGVTPIDAEGQPFDPNLHEAITYMPSADAPEGMIVAQTRRGYKIGDKLLRAAQVVVSSGQPDA